MNSKQKGDVALAKAISYFMESEYEVLLPIGDKRPYDLVVEDKEGNLIKIQSKYTSHKTKYGKYVVPLRVMGGNRSSGNNIKKYDKKDSTKIVVKTVRKKKDDKDDKDDKEEKKENLSNDTEEKKKPVKRKTKIPATVRKIVWATYIGENNSTGKCLCCSTEEISLTNFECGHIKSEKNGGETTIENLRPICGHCNKSIGSKNMDEFMEKYKIKQPSNWFGCS